MCQDFLSKNSGFNKFERSIAKIIKQKPAKKSGFMARLEEAQRQQQKAMQQKKR